LDVSSKISEETMSPEDQSVLDVVMEYPFILTTHDLIELVCRKCGYAPMDVKKSIERLRARRLLVKGFILNPNVPMESPD